MKLKNGILQSEMSTPQKIEISHRTVIFTIVFLILISFVYYIRDIILQFFVALLIMTILNPFVTKLAKLKIPRAISILLVYLIVFLLVSISFAGLVPPLLEQTSNLVNNIPGFLENLGASGAMGERLLSELLSQIGLIPGRAARFTAVVFSNLLSVLAILIFAFYLLLARNKLDYQIGVFFGDKARKEIKRMLDLLETKLGGWMRGQAFLMILIWVTTYIGLRVLGIPFALPLSILAGLLEIIPYAGPVVSAIPAVLIGLGISPLMGLSVVALYFLIQQLENYVFVPKIMERSTGISPIVTLLALAIGFKIAGIGGVIISVPVVIIMHVLVEEYFLVENKARSASK
jgi:predicted PurR-regulated permease PerM